METKTTIKKLFGFAYLLQEQKTYYGKDLATNERKVLLVTRDTLLFDIKIHSTQITF